MKRQLQLIQMWGIRIQNWLHYACCYHAIIKLTSFRKRVIDKNRSVSWNLCYIQIHCIHVQRQLLPRTPRARWSQLMRIQQQWVGLLRRLLGSTMSTLDQGSHPTRHRTFILSLVWIRLLTTRSRWQSMATLALQETMSNATEKQVCTCSWCNYPIAPLLLWSWVTLKVILKDFTDARSSCDSQTVLLLSDASFWQTHYSSGARFTKYLMIYHEIILSCWWRGTVVERRSLAGELSLSCARPAADGWPLMWVSHPL